MKVLNKKNVTQNFLKNKSENIVSLAEADVLIALLENILKEDYSAIFCLAAPEINVFKKIAIIRNGKTSINLINPKIIKQQNKILSIQESCISFNGVLHNCVRYNKVFIENGFSKEIIQLQGQDAILAQHAIDHLNGITFYERLVKIAIVRKDGEILKKDFCICGSKKRFEECCEKDANQ